MKIKKARGIHAKIRNVYYSESVGRHYLTPASAAKAEINAIINHHYGSTNVKGKCYYEDPVKYSRWFNRLAKVICHRWSINRLYGYPVGKLPVDETLLSIAENETPFSLNIGYQDYQA